MEGGDKRRRLETKVEVVVVEVEVEEGSRLRPKNRSRCRQERRGTSRWTQREREKARGLTQRPSGRSTARRLGLPSLSELGGRVDEDRGGGERPKGRLANNEAVGAAFIRKTYNTDVLRNHVKG